MDDKETAQEKLERIANTSHLLTAIERLEHRRKMQEEGLSVVYHEMLVTLKPKNILKNTLKEVSESTPMKQNLLKIAVGLGAGYFSRKLLVRETAGPIKKILGTALQYGVTNFVASREPDVDHTHISTGTKVGNFFKKLLAKRRETA